MGLGNDNIFFFNKKTITIRSFFIEIFPILVGREGGEFWNHKLPIRIPEDIACLALALFLFISACILEELSLFLLVCSFVLLAFTIYSEPWIINSSY